MAVFKIIMVKQLRSNNQERKPMNSPPPEKVGDDNEDT